MRVATPAGVKESRHPPLAMQKTAPANAVRFPADIRTMRGCAVKKTPSCRHGSPNGIVSDPPAPEGVKEPLGAAARDHAAEFSAWLTLVLERCRAENIRNLPRQRAPTPLFPERRPREACSMPISGRHDLPLATFNLPSRVFRHGCRRARSPERRWGGFFHTLSRSQAPATTAARSRAPGGTPSSRYAGGRKKSKK